MSLLNYATIGTVKRGKRKKKGVTGTVVWVEGYDPVDVTLVQEADKVEVAPGVTVASLRRFRTALIGPTQGLPKRRRLCH